MQPEGTVEPDPPPEESRHWLSWVLVAGCAAPALLLAEAARRVLRGGYDAQYFGGYPAAYLGDADATDRLDVTTAERFQVLWSLLSLPGPLLGAAVVGVLVVAVVLAGRPAWLVPDRWGRRVAALALWLAAAVSAGVVAGVLQGYSAPVESQADSLQVFLGNRSPDDFPGVAGALALLLPAVVVPALGGAVLWRTGDAPPVVPAGGAVPDEDEEDEAQDPGPPGPEGAAAAPVPEREPAAPVSPPTVPEAQRHLYRRPG